MSASGGDPVGLLRRCAEILQHRGTTLVELDAGSGWRQTKVRLESSATCSEWLDWAFVGRDAIHEVAGAAGLSVRERWHDSGRWFASLVAA